MTRLVDFILIFLIAFVSIYIIDYYFFDISQVGEAFILYYPFVIVGSLISYLLLYKNLEKVIENIKLLFRDEFFNGIFLGVTSYLYIRQIIGIWLTIIIFATYICCFIILFIRNNKKIDIKKNVAFEKDLSCPIYFNVIKTPGPLKDIKDDDYQRQDLVEKLSNLIVSTPNQNITIGINGVWGMGKTTLLNFVQTRLCNHSEKLYFSAWDYRESKRFVEVMLKSIGKKLDSLSGTKNLFSDLFKKLFITISGHHSVFGIKIDLNSAIEIRGLKKLIEDKINIHHQLIIYLDDLDRLDREDLINVIKSINMIYDLPQIRFVLAYDKNILLNLIEKNNEINALDYFSKIVHCEIDLSIPSSELRKKLLLKIINDLSEITNYQELESLNQFVNEDDLTYCVFKLLQTPRELRKILSFSIWRSINHNGGKNLDFVDMLVLTIFQYRVPKLYEALQTNSEQIISVLSRQMGIHDLQNNAAVYEPVNNERDSETKDGIIIEQLLEKIHPEIKRYCKALLKYILPSIFNEKVEQNQVLLYKKICHPFLYYSYFHYTYENFADDYIKLLGTIDELIDKDAPAEEYNEFILNNKDHLSHNWVWNSFINYFLSKAKNKNFLFHSILKISKTLGYSKDNHFESELSIFSLRQYIFAFEVSLQPEEWQKILKFLKEPSLEYRYGMLAYIIKAIISPDHFSLSRRIKLDIEGRDGLTESLTQFAKRYFNGKLKDYMFYDFLGLLAWTKLDDELKKYILEAVTAENEVLFNILDVYARPMFSNIKGLDDNLGYQDLRNIVDTKLKNGDLKSEKLKELDKNRLEIFLAYGEKNDLQVEKE
ncbi:Predicted P-loop ATPase [Legionella sainthelensi]|uniref:P-loop NTPase fold protein n=1 Tax=Legionella sainthelensi TaxID=28087 RepID=UPI000F707131|nr:P-loop NTPase fold protein [Legionella sainthelensi]VEB35420.1 Predicted P-loop ATPase [Legionella sainthelensi]